MFQSSFVAKRLDIFGELTRRKTFHSQTLGLLQPHIVGHDHGDTFSFFIPLSDDQQFHRFAPRISVCFDDSTLVFLSTRSS